MVVEKDAVMYVPTVDVVVEHPSLPRLLVTSLLLGKEVTLRIPLSIEQVQQRLLDQMRI